VQKQSAHGMSTINGSSVKDKNFNLKEIYEYY
jgi:hypothetical protein